VRIHPAVPGVDPGHWLPRRTAALLCTLILAAAWLCGCGRSPSPGAGHPFLKVGAIAYTEQDLRSIFNSMPLNIKQQYTDQEGTVDLPAFARFVAGEIAFADEASGEHLDRVPETDAMIRWSRDRTMSQAYARNHIYRKLVSDEELMKVYNARKEQYKTPTRYHIRYLLITPVREDVVYNSRLDDAVTAQQGMDKVEKVRSLLQKGEELQDLARQYSEDRTAVEGGDPGWLSETQLAPEVIGALRTMRNGEVRGPIFTSAGYQFAQLLESRPAHVIAFDLVKEDLMREAMGEHQAELKALMDQKIQDLRNHGQIVLP
jgi:parvulin-like peptidyl-prolyl isomerase